MRNTKKLVGYRFDDRTMELIEELKTNLELDSNSAVLRRAITLLKIASESDSIVVIKGGKEREVLL